MFYGSGNKTMRPVILLLAGIVLLGLLAPASGEAAKRSFGKKGCIDCHGDFAKQYLAKKNVHPVVKEQKCEECHLPHGIVPKLLLKESGNKICLLCHSKESIGLDQPVIHTALKNGKCETCHDPHASDNPFLLSSSGNDICFSCHQQEPFSKKVVHGIIKEEGCLACHKAHASAEENLLVEKPLELCISCHSSTEKSFAKAHGGYPVEQKSCTTCHDPHSSRPGQSA